MTKTTKYLAPLAAGLAFSVMSAHATLITINDGTSNQPANSGQATIEAWLDLGVKNYNTAHDPDLPYPPGNEVFRVNQTGESPDAPPAEYSDYPVFGADKLSITIPTGDFSYVALHWGGKGGGVYQSFYIGDIGGSVPATITFQAPGKNGLSWYDVFDPTGGPTPPIGTPDTGSTLGLLGLACAGLAVLRRRMNQA